MLEVKFRPYLADPKVLFVEAGYHKFMVYNDNVDINNTMVLFSILMFDEPMNIHISESVSRDFWKDWIEFFSSYTGIKRQVTFTNTYSIAEIEHKRAESALLFSGTFRMHRQ